MRSGDEWCFQRQDRLASAVWEPGVARLKLTRARRQDYAGLAMSDGPDPGVLATVEPIDRRDDDALTLMARFRPNLANENKRIVFGIACPPGTARGTLSYSRWAEMPLPDRVQPAAAADLALLRDGFYDYAPLREDDGAPVVTGAGHAVEWHVNFADDRLFVACGWPAFVQDEMQVAEHPTLAALKEAIIVSGRPAVTVYAGRPTPVLVLGVERRIAIATDPNDAEGRPDGLYGRRFRTATEETLRRAITTLDPPTITNLIAITAPHGGTGRYRLEEIELALSTAFTGFRAAVLESGRVAGPGVRVVVHSGFWGGGVFGGSRVMLTLLQVLAAQMAGLDRLVFHVGDPAQPAPVLRALAVARDLAPDATPESLPTRDVIRRIDAMAMVWGSGDGN